MFTAKPQKNRGAATTYFDEHLSHNDYYTQGEEQAGYWLGKGAERLGLKEAGTVSREAFLRLCDNLHPQTGDKLTPLQLAQRRVFFDFTCSAPKSVSILSVTMQDRRILEAHREASNRAMKELEAFVATRVRRGGAMEDRATGELVAAAFRHTSSRALDPQLHTHFTIFNATFDPVEKRWKAVQSSAMYRAIRYGTAVYRNELAQRLHALGYRTRKARHGFEIDGVAPELITRFSKRSRQRNLAVAREEARVGRKLTNDEVSNLVHKSRPKKIKDASEREVRAQQLDELGFFEKLGLQRVVNAARGEAWVPEVADRVGLAEAVRYAQAHVFDRQSVAPEHDLFEAALMKGCGQLDLAAVKQAFRRGAEFVRVGNEVSTRAILEAELRLLRSVDAGQGQARPLKANYRAPAHFSADQQAALVHLALSRDRVTGIKGLAGTGKTTALKELAGMIMTAGFEGVFVTPTAQTAQMAREDGFSDAMTLAKLLSDPKAQQRVAAGSVIVLDEAGAVGIADLQKLLDLAAARDARVILAGDTGQHASVAQGDALRLIEEHSSYRYALLGEIRRQTVTVFRQAVKLASQKDTAGAFALLESQGCIIEGPTDVAQLYAQATAAYVEAMGAKRTALLVAPTWEEIAALTDGLRRTLKADGTLVGRDQDLPTFASLSWTDAQKAQAEHFVTEAGTGADAEQRLLVRFVKKTEQFQAGEIAEVLAVKGKTVVLRGGDGKPVVWHPSRSPESFDVGERRALPVAVGDWLLLRANATVGLQKFTNGERVRVKAIGAEGVALEDGRVLPSSYRTFTHGYAITSHAAQGKTVDEVMFVASHRSFPAVCREGFYVGISRARLRARVFTDDAEILKERVQAAHTRKAALELQELRAELIKHGLLRAVAAPAAAQTVKEPEPVRVVAAPRAPEAPRATRRLRAVRTRRVGQRVQRSASWQTVQDWVRGFRRWLGQRLGQGVAAAPAAPAAVAAQTPQAPRAAVKPAMPPLFSPRPLPDGRKNNQGQSRLHP